ncbi:ATP/GTP-binding protein [Streptomyces sp. ISL-22]|uniref:ATP/GTP-binding protein n=1 Tax=unclassified Streptomyces TaxID=2593676 RepID=UPI001BE97CA1|nr:MULTISPECIES: ATP/GTP-binding protein [unclassified Streptomyces]MBT2421015.1 ATP/GTP-binding protein [Streptomyces sp. ISL-24]MBT2430897.1 ATP/GTP-binding protein [Streptomyces sp. ISL-22]
MNSDGTQDARGTHATPVPRPAVPPEVPTVPPRPTQAPGQPTPSGIAGWLNEPRPETRTGIWRLGYRPPEGADEQQRLSPMTIVGMVIPAVVGLIIWSFWLRGAIPYQWAPLRLVTPDDWWEPATEINAKPGGWGIEAFIAYRGVSFALLVWAMARLGSWGRVFRYYFARKTQPRRAALTAIWALLALALVFPSAFPGAFWDPVPVVDPLLNLTIALSQSYELLQSPLYVYSLYTAITLLVIWPFARVGDWRAYAKERLALRRSTGRNEPARPAPVPPAQWPALRDAGQHQAADVLTAEVLAGRMNDVDCARIEHGWARARTQGRLADFTDTVLRQGAAAFTHPSGARDLHGRAAWHDLLTGQVRIGQWAATERTPPAYGGVGAALGPETLATSLLVVGPSGAGKTRHVIAPVAESLTLQALTGRCAVVVVCGRGAAVGADSSYDVVVRVGDASSVHDLDPYADADDPDEAAGFLAEALAGDLDTVGAERAATALAQLLGPYRAAYGRFPTLPVLRELLEGDPAALADLRERLADDRHTTMRRELEARVRQTGTAGDAGPVLAGRLALLDRPAFADFFGAGGDTIRPFSLRAVAHHPLRVRIDLPERGHEEASRLIARLVLAQFTTVVREGSRDHFVGLVLDDATGTVTPESVRRIQRLRSHNAGVVLALRTVSDVPEALHGPLYGAVGCRMALAGVTTWDGGRFADAWGTEWVETKEVAQHTVFADQPMTRAMHALRKLVTGKAVTTEAVTVRQVERERWSASELAHGVPPGHAVLSLTSVKGEHAPPLLVDLRG